MAQTEARKFSPFNVALDGVLTLAAFVVFFRLCGPHVPSNNPTLVAFWSAYCSACMSGVFWLAWQMLKAVYRHQQETAAAKRRL